jgi:hypothetical protein
MDEIPQFLDLCQNRIYITWLIRRPILLSWKIKIFDIRKLYINRSILPVKTGKKAKFDKLLKMIKIMKIKDTELNR